MDRSVLENLVIGRSSERYCHTCSRALVSEGFDLLLFLDFCLSSLTLLLSAIIQFTFSLTHWRAEIS